MKKAKSKTIKLGVGPYIRFGEIPESEQSKSYGMEPKEAGVSCYECLKIEDKYRILYPPYNNRWDKAAGILSVMLQRFMNNSTKCYLINGDVVGRGSDNEPVLKNIKVIKELSVCDFDVDIVI